MKLLFIFLAFICILNGCSKDGVAGGSGTEAESITALIFTDSSGNTLDDITLYILPQDSIVPANKEIMPIAHKTIDGVVEIEELEVGEYFIEVVSDRSDSVVSGLFPLTIDSATNETLDTASFVVSTKRGNISGTVNNDTAFIAIPGTRYSKIVTNGSEFVFANLPQGEYTLFIQAGNDTIMIQAITEEPLGTLDFSSKNSILLDNFENSDKWGTSAFEADSTKVLWFAFSNGTQLFPTEENDEVPFLFSFDSVRNSNVLSTEMLVTSLGAENAGVGLTLFEVNAIALLDSTFSLSYWSKGTGVYELRVDLVVADTREVFHFTRTITLDSDWGYHTVELSDFHYPNNFIAPVNVNSCKIIFYAVDDVVISIDDLSASGINN